MSLPVNYYRTRSGGVVRIEGDASAGELELITGDGAAAYSQALGDAQVPNGAK